MLSKPLVLLFLIGGTQYILAAEGGTKKSDTELRTNAVFYAADSVRAETCRRAGISAPSEDEIKRSRSWTASDYKNPVFLRKLAEEIQFLKPMEPRKRADLLRGCGMLSSYVENRRWVLEGLPAGATASAANEALAKKDYIAAGRLAVALLSTPNSNEAALLLARSYSGRASENPLLAYPADHWFRNAASRGDMSAHLEVGLLHATALRDFEEAYKWLYALSVDGRASDAQRKVGRIFAEKIGGELSFGKREDIRRWVESNWSPRNRKPDLN